VLDAVLEIDQVTKRFGDTVAVRDLSAAVRAGEILGLVGAPGAGTTTALRIAAGVLAPDSGRVSWRSGPLTPATRSRLGYLPQRRDMYPDMDLLGNLVFLAELHGMDTNRAHRNALLWIDRFGLRAHRGHRFHTLDAAARRLANLAGALCHEPDVLVLDDPFADLDRTETDMVSGVLRGLADAGAAVLFSARRLDIAEEVCDRVSMIHNGQLAVEGSVPELRGTAARLAIVDVPEAEADWPERLEHCRLRARTGTRLVLELDEDADEQAVLAAARATGPVTEFCLRRATLADLYADTVPVAGAR
jgi:ABC-2 type transport system ATP-binding protein